MGEAKRRKDRLSLESRQENIDNILEAGQGVYRLEICAPENLLDTFGPVYAAAAMQFAIDTVKLEWIDCFICDDHKIGPKAEDIAVFVFLTPNTNPSGLGSISAICPHCARKPNLTELALERIRKSLVSDARYIRISNQTGHA